MAARDAFTDDGPWGEWLRSWTAEEARHATALRDYVHLARLVDPWLLEDARHHHMRSGGSPHPPGFLPSLVYVALQELATRVAHGNTAQRLDDVGRALLRRIAADENLHFLFYRDLARAALEIDPSATMVAIADQVETFAMPGVGIRDFAAHARAIDAAGIFGLAALTSSVFAPMVRVHWNIEQVEGLDREGEDARARALRRLERLERACAWRAEKDGSGPAGGDAD